MTNTETTTIELGNIGSEEKARKIHAVLQNRTYYNFQVDYGSVGGIWPVTVSTSYIGADGQAPEQAEVMGMIMFCLASSL